MTDAARVRRLLVGSAIVVALVAAVGLGWQWYAERGTGTEVGTGERLLPGGGPVLADTEVVWAQDAVLYLDGTPVELGQGRAQELTWTPYGVFVRMVTGEGPVRTVLATASAVTDVPGLPGTIAASADGRYAAWVDRDGPAVPMGPRAELVVVDLERGTELLRSGAGLGDRGDDFVDLYSELDPQALGFEGTGDDLVVVYRNAEGGGDIVGLDVSSGRPVAVPQRPDGAGDALDAADLPAWTFSPRVGAGAAVDGGRLSDGGVVAVLAPERDLLVRTGQGDRIRVLTVPDGADVTPELPPGSTRLGAFLPGGDLLVVHQWRSSATTLHRCAVAGGTCEVVAQAPRRRGVVVLVPSHA